MSARELGAAELCRLVNERLGSAALNRAAVWRYAERGQTPPASIRAAIADVLGLTEGDLFEAHRRSIVHIQSLPMNCQRIVGDVDLTPDLLSSVQGIRRESDLARCAIWGALIRDRVRDLRISGRELARRVAQHSGSPLASIMVQVNRYLRGLSFPRSPQMRDVVLSALHVQPDAISPLILFESSIRCQPWRGGARAHLDLILSDDLAAKFGRVFLEAPHAGA